MSRLSRDIDPKNLHDMQFLADGCRLAPFLYFTTKAAECLATTHDWPWLSVAQYWTACPEKQKWIDAALSILVNAEPLTPAKAGKVIGFPDGEAS